MSDAGPLPLGERCPALGRLPRAPLGRVVSPVARVALDDGAALWVKRDDLAAPVMGGNKLRALEFLLGGVRPGDVVLTLGGQGSTHVLATAVHAARLGARTRAVRWPHEMNEVAHLVARRIDAACERAPLLPAPLALLRLALWRLRLRGASGRPPRLVPFGGASPLGALGHVNAGLELRAQIDTGLLPAPARVVVPLGTGGTAAGLALGLALAGIDAELVCARVGPRVAATRGRVLRLAAATRRLARRLGADLPPPVAVRVVHDAYGGAYGRPLPAGTAAARRLDPALAARLDATYSAKAAAAALALVARPGPTLFWLTFDGRGLDDARSAPMPG